MNNYEPIFEKPIGWTSIEQAKKLVAAGLVPNTADMYYYAVQKFDGNEYVNTGEWQLAVRMFDGEEHFKYLIDTFGTDEFDNFVPCWSVGRLIEYLPKEIEHIEKHCVKDRIEKSNKNQFFFLASTCHCFLGMFRRSSTVGQSTSVNSVVRLPT